MEPNETPEQFLYRSFRLLDLGKFDEWIATCSENISIVLKSRHDREPFSEIALINDDFERLRGRIEQIKRYWHAESPPTRTLHSISNVELEPQSKDVVLVNSCFTVIATRRYQQDILYGRYRDLIRYSGNGWQLESREAVLENDVIERGKISFIV